MVHADTRVSFLRTVLFDMVEKLLLEIITCSYYEMEPHDICSLVFWWTQALHCLYGPYQVYGLK